MGGAKGLSALFGGDMLPPGDLPAGAEGLGLTGRGLHDTTRLASSPPTIWRDICTTNADEIRGALDSLIKELSSLRDELGTGNAIESLFESAAKWRGRLPRQTRSRDT